MFRAFPVELGYDVSKVLGVISTRTYNDCKIGVTDYGSSYLLLDGESVSIPYRVYYLDECISKYDILTFNQKMIYHAIFTRSCNGFIREKHIRAILQEDFPEWVIPYIIKVSDEYVMEILETVYLALKDRDTERIKAFCRLNIKSFLYSHDRMISYWSEFYRGRCYFYKNYVGKQLFEECFGYTRSMEKERRT